MEGAGTIAVESIGHEVGGATTVVRVWGGSTLVGGATAAGPVGGATGADPVVGVRGRVQCEVGGTASASSSGLPCGNTLWNR